METALKNCDLWLYADDTCIFYSLQNVKFIETDLNYVFNNFCEWLKITNSLYILEKIKLKVFCSKEEKNLSLNITRN